MSTVLPQLAPHPAALARTAGEAVGYPGDVMGDGPRG